MSLWDETLAKNLVGSILLVGLTHEKGGNCSYEQFFGVVMKCDRERGITLHLKGSREGSTYNLPSDMRPIYPAEPGEYRLRQTEEIVKNPDYIATWLLSATSPSAPQ